jgi:hypothetical protein
MQDPDLRPSRRAVCAALIQCCRVHEVRRSYSARLASSVVWGADAAVLFAASVTILLTP